MRWRGVVSKNIGLKTLTLPKDISSEDISLAHQLINAYCQGIFPMAEDAEDADFHWIRPKIRAIMPLDERFHIPGSLRKTLRKTKLYARFTDQFTQIIDACAATTKQQTASSPTAISPRDSTWINHDIRRCFITLHRLGFAHAIGVFDENHRLQGGLYGLALGGAFFGESMFSYQSSASKIALVALVQHLRQAGFILLDCQFENPHLTPFGAITLPQEDYMNLLSQALHHKPIELGT